MGAHHANRMMKAPRATAGRLARADTRMSAPAGSAVAEGAETAGPTIRPDAAQLLGASGGAPPSGVALQRSGKGDKSFDEKIKQGMAGKSHAPHGGSKDSNTHAQAKGFKGGKTYRRLLEQAEAARLKREAEAAKPKQKK